MQDSHVQVGFYRHMHLVGLIFPINTRVCTHIDQQNRVNSVDNVR